MARNGAVLKLSTVSVTIFEVLQQRWSRENKFIQGRYGLLTFPAQFILNPPQQQLNSA